MSSRPAAAASTGMWFWRMEPGEPGSGIVFENDIVGGVIPKEYIPAVEKGVREAAEGGVLAGYPVTDIKVRLYDGSFHEVDSNEMAFKMAGSMAFKEGAAKGGPVLLEPIMKVEVVVPEEFLGDIMGQLNARRGEILGMEDAPWRMPRPSVRWCRWQKCLVMPPICARPPRDAVCLRWNSIIMPGCQKMWPVQLSGADRSLDRLDVSPGLKTLRCTDLFRNDKRREHLWESRNLIGASRT